MALSGEVVWYLFYIPERVNTSHHLHIVAVASTVGMLERVLCLVFFLEWSFCENLAKAL